MKGIIICLIFVFLTSCDSNEKSSEKRTSQNQDEGIKTNITVKTQEPNLIPRILSSSEDKVNYDALNWEVKSDIQKLDSIYPFTPFYGSFEGEKFFVIRNQGWDYNQEWFNDSIQYGLLNSRYEMVLGLEYTKIGNPNLILEGCFEIEENGKYGLYDHKTNEILKPQFEYILSASFTNSKVAYGLKNGIWFEITNHSNFKLSEIDIDITEILKKVSFDVTKLGANLMYYSYSETHENDATTGRGIAVFPSFIEKLNLLDNEMIWDLITSKKYPEGFGTKEERVTLSQNEGIGDRLISFFVSVYSSGTDARGYEVQSKKLLTYNLKDQTMNSSFLGKSTMYDYFCRESGYSFVNDSIVEIKSNTQEGKLYDFETQYTYKKILSNGEIQDLSSNRIFDFTKFIVIKEEHLKGCFAEFMEKPKFDYSPNIWVTEHMSIADLDLMRNEIFADYGYKFKTEKWQNYFGGKAWYKPLYNDVNDKLTETDKINVQTILRVKKKMEGNEDNFLNKHASIYVAAG
jgi:hypothetical protein